MEEKSKSSSIYALNVGRLLLVLSIIGSTPRFVVISVTLVSWLQTQWLAYTSALKKRHSERLAAAADEDRTRRRKQVADITEEIGGNVISLLDKRRQELVLRLDEEAERKRRSYQQDIVTKITGHLADFQESERVKDEQRLKIREDEILQRERELKAKEQALQKLREELDGRKKELEDSERALEEQQEDLEEREKEAEDRERDLQAQQEDLEEREQELEDSERYLHTRQKKVEERERKAKAAEADLQKLHQKQEELKIQRRVANQRTTTVATPNPLFSPDLPSLASNSITLPSELLQYAKDLNSYYFTCIGVTKKGTRCGQSMISNADKSAASRRIAKMASPDAGDGTDLYEMQALRELADWMLCPRWHRDKLPQGAEIARRWYGELRDARAANTRPVSSWKTPSSAGAASIFSSTGTGNYSTGTTASSFGSSMQSVSMSYTSSDYQFTSPDNAASGPPGFGHPVARHLTPVFEFMAEQSAVTKKGFGQWN